MQIGWVYEPVVSHYEYLLLYNATIHRKETFYYIPIAVAKREEIGMKYRFLCIAKPMTYSDPPSHFAEIEVYKPLSGMPYATCIYRLDFDKMFSQRVPYI